MTLSTSAYWSTLFPHVYAQKKRRSSSARQDLCSYARHCKASRTKRAKIAFYLARLVLTPRPSVIRQRRDSKMKIWWRWSREKVDEDSRSKRFFATFKKISRCGVFNSSQQCIRGTGVLSRFLTMEQGEKSPLRKDCKITIASARKFRLQLLRVAQTHFERSETAESNY